MKAFGWPTTYALKQGAELLRDYDGFETAATVAALQLLPQNACQLSRLEATARILAATPPQPHRSAPSQGRLRRLLNNEPFSTELAVNDPIYDDVLCESVGFIGGDYLVASGLAAETPGRSRPYRKTRKRFAQRAPTGPSATTPRSLPLRSGTGACSMT